MRAFGIVEQTLNNCIEVQQRVPVKSDTRCYTNVSIQSIEERNSRILSSESLYISIKSA